MNLSKVVMNVLAKENPILHTKFGKARLEKGYYIIKNGYALEDLM